MDIDLPRALSIIKSLQDQINEINNASKDYENEMESVIQNLSTELIQKNNRIIQLEIEIDQVNNDKQFLCNKITNLQAETDNFLEQNILLEHEIHDLRQVIEEKHSGIIEKDPTPTKKLKTCGDKLRVKTTHSSLYISPSKTANAQISNSQVISSTAPSSHL